MNEHIKSWVLSKLDNTDAEIVTEYSNLPDMTRDAISLKELASALRRRGFMSLLRLVADDPDTPQSLALGIKDFIDQVADPRANFISTDEPDIATRAWDVLDLLISTAELGEDEAGEFKSSIESLGNGIWNRDSLTESEVADIRDWSVRDERGRELITEMNDHAAAKVAEIESWVENGGTEPTVP